MKTGIKNVRAADELKISTQELCDRNSALFVDLAKKINLSYDVFFRSSNQKEHWPGVQKIWKSCIESGDIYKKKYRGLYCVGCEQFYTENELVSGLCPEHKTKPELIEEENYFFKLSKYQEKLRQLIESGELKVIPETRKNEVLSFIKSGLDDFSVSRSVQRTKGWGVPVPDDPGQIIYVWIDALSIYMTGIGFGTDQSKYERWWPANVHVIGKGIIRFHAVYWPAILLSAKLKIPKSIFVHGYLNVEGQKMSKSIGNVINPLEILDRYTADELRYYLVRDIPTFEDGDFSESSLKDRVNKELLGDLGNLVNRVLTIVEKSGFKEFTGDKELEARLDVKRIEALALELKLHESLGAIMEFVRDCNKYINEKEPWKLKGEELNIVLYNLLESIRIISILLYPFIPETSEKIAEKLGTKITTLDDCKFREKYVENLQKGGYLFKKRE